MVGGVRGKDEYAGGRRGVMGERAAAILLLGKQPRAQNHKQQWKNEDFNCRE